MDKATALREGQLAMNRGEVNREWSCSVRIDVGGLGSRDWGLGHSGRHR